MIEKLTREVETGALAEVLRIINRLTFEGKAVVVVSSSLPKGMLLSDRLLVALKAT